jgi:hypothetical protein
MLYSGVASGLGGRILRAVGYVLFLAAFPTAVACVFHHRYARAELRTAQATLRDEVPGVDTSIQNLVGYVNGHAGSSFTLVERRKPAGRIRIGCFGDSYTFGQEVAHGQDFPSRLATLLHERGRTDVEVLNFGVPWHGFHQSYLMWERLGRAYDLDYVVMGPGCFHPQRDMTFNHTQGRDPAYIHARFVLDGDGVRLVEVVGETIPERVEAYVRLFPPWRYLRYDRQPPAVLRALTSAGRELPNPFYYYRGDARSEALVTYRRLLAMMAGAEPRSRFLLTHLEPEIASLAGAVGAPNLVGWPARVPQNFPYLAPQGHLSAFGNELVATDLVRALAAGGDTQVVVRTADAARPQALEGARRSIRGYREAAITLDTGEVVGGFAEATRASRLESKLLARAAAPSLLGLQPADGAALDACFVPVNRELEAGAPVELRRGSTRLPIGAVRLLTADAAMGTVTLAAAEISCSVEEGLRFTLPPAQDARDGSWEMAVGGTTILTGTVSSRVVSLLPGHQQLIVIRSSREWAPVIAAWPQSGDLWLDARADDGAALRVRMARWWKEERPAPVPAPAGPLAPAVEGTVRTLAAR